MIKIVLKIFLLIIAVAFVIKSWLSYSCSFRIDKIQPSHFFDNNYNDHSDHLDLDLVLNQKFKFLSKGRHTFVFRSEDNKYVIKFFRFHRYKLPITFQLCKSLPWIKNFSEKLQKELNILYFETMDSYKLVYEKLQTETATIYVHLNKSNDLNKKIIVVDKFKISHTIDLDNYGFIIQKKAKSFSKELIKVKNDKKALEKLLIAFFSNLESIYKKNIINNDRHVLNNLGVIDNRVVEIDTGRFALKQELNKKHILEKEAYHYTMYLKKWLSKNIPDALPILDSQLIKLMQFQIDEDNHL